MTRIIVHAGLSVNKRIYAALYFVFAFWQFWLIVFLLFVIRLIKLNARSTQLQH